ncbi:MAG: hypothetical protein EDX89_15170 [Acidobacteria bacterium]|nr:MAG: hypothetical protein EDX89_15170 [Acidobacteriota bacterium]
MRRYYPFGGSSAVLVTGALRSAEDWDGLRTEPRETFFSISPVREEWLRHCTGGAEKDGTGNLTARADAIVAVVRELRLTGIESFGVGGAYLEFNLKSKAPDLHLAVSDVGDGWRKRLSAVFHECDEIRVLDLTRDPMPTHPERLYLLHRVETSFSNREWKRVFFRLAQAGAEYVLFVPSGLLSVEYWWREVKALAARQLRGTRSSFAGYVRNRDGLQALWRREYSLIAERDVGGLHGFLLRRSSSA